MNEFWHEYFNILPHFIAGVVWVYVFQWYQRRSKRRWQLKKGLRFECPAKGCDVSAWGDYPETIAKIRMVHYDQYPEHAHG